MALTTKTTLLQNTYSRTRRIASDTYVVTEISHADEVRAQLPDLDQDHIIVEPARRGTASCVLLGLAVIKKRNNDQGQPIVVMWADHHIENEDGFAKSVKTVAMTSVKHRVITLVGLSPTYPATGFEYIEVGDAVEAGSGSNVHKVMRFIKRPDIETARQYLAAGNYWWNMGLFAAPLEVYEEAIKTSAPEMFQDYEVLVKADAQGMKEHYLQLPSQSIDMALIQKVSNLLVTKGLFDWADIGSFLDLHKILQGKDHNALRGDVELIDCQNSMIHGSGKPIIAIGLNGIVIVDTPEGLLVCAKEKSQLVGEAVQRLQRKTDKK